MIEKKIVRKIDNYLTIEFTHRKFREIYFYKIKGGEDEN